MGYGNQRKELSRGVDIIAATPGRLMDYLKAGTINLRDINTLVLDEVDHMLDMGFLPVVKDIISRCPRERQTLLFSATVPPEIQAIASFALRNPSRIEVGIARTVNEAVKHALYPVGYDQKFDLLLALLETWSSKIDLNSLSNLSRLVENEEKNFFCFGSTVSFKPNRSAPRAKPN